MYLLSLQGLGNAFLSHVNACDALFHVMSESLKPFVLYSFVFLQFILVNSVNASLTILVNFISTIQYVYVGVFKGKIFCKKLAVQLSVASQLAAV